MRVSWWRLKWQNRTRWIIEEGFIQKRRQRSSLLCWGAYTAQAISQPGQFEEKSFGRTSILGGSWFGVVVNWKIIHVSEASVPPSVHFSIHPFLPIAFSSVYIDPSSMRRILKTSDNERIDLSITKKRSIWSKNRWSNSQPCSLYQLPDNSGRIFTCEMIRENNIGILSNS